jgi:hypothetical protein
MMKPELGSAGREAKPALESESGTCRTRKETFWWLCSSHPTPCHSGLARAGLGSNTSRHAVHAVCPHAPTGDGVSALGRCFRRHRLRCSRRRMAAADAIHRPVARQLPPRPTGSLRPCQKRAVASYCHLAPIQGPPSRRGPPGATRESVAHVTETGRAWKRARCRIDGRT